MIPRLLLLIALAGSAFGADLQQQLEQLAAAHHGKVALYAKQLKTGATVAIQADVPVATASVIKLPILIEAFTQAKAGKLHLDERVPLTKDNQVEGSGVLNLFKPGLQPTLEDCLALMIAVSDNTAANMMMDAVTIPAVNQRIAAMGMKNTYLYRKVFKPAEEPMPADQKQFGLGKTTAREMGAILESIERCDLGDAALCERMLRMLKNNQNGKMLPRTLQTTDTSVKPSAIAHKDGSLDRVRNDVGLVYTSAGPILISVFTWDNQDRSWGSDNQAEILIGRIAKTIVDAWAPRASEAAAPKK